MRELVNVDDLQQALDNIITRFPYYQVKLTRGFLWYKWKATDEKPQVMKELDYPCQYIPIRSGYTFPFRIIANFNQIIIEFNHSLTDGHGALIFLKALVTEYLAIQGFVIADYDDIFRPHQKPSLDEFEYAYRKHFKIGIPKTEKIYRAFHLPFEREKIGISYVTNGKMDVNDVIKLSREWKVSLTEFIAAVYIDALQDIMFEFPEKQLRKLKRPLRIMLPLNARYLIPSNTMRNFTAFIAPGVDPRLGEFSFQEIINQVHHHKNLYYNEKFIIQQISNYVGLAINPFIHASPYFLKLLFIKPLYRKAGEALFSAFLTNLGKVKLPLALSEEILDIQLLPMNHPYFKSGMGLLTYFDDLNINFVRNIKENIVEEKFFNKLREFGINVEVRDLF